MKKSKHVYSTSKCKTCCCNKSFLYIPSCSKHIPSIHLSLIPPQHSHYSTMNAFRKYSSPLQRLVSTVISASKESMSKQFPRSRSESKLNNLEMSNPKQIPTDTVVSEIVKKEQPYKEVEAIINDNRVIIRMHKEPVKEKYDPPCECIGQVASKESALSQRKCDDGVVFDMAHGNLKLGCTPREDAPLTKKTCEEAGCRTVTLYPSVKGNVRSASTAYNHMESREVQRSRTVRSIDVEENPNIFLLRIRKRCDSSDKKQTIDLEFRAPRPWLRKKEDLLKPETLEKYEDVDKEHEDDKEGDIDKEYKDEEKHEDDTYESMDTYESYENIE